MKNVVAINAGPRKNWNTDKLIKAAGEGAGLKGANVEYIDLYQLGQFMGGRSCFACKLPDNYGKCVFHDGLYDVLEKISKTNNNTLKNIYYMIINKIF